MTGDLSREHWTVPVHGLTGADPDGIVQAIAHRDGTVSLHMICGNSYTTGWLNVSRAAQLSTGIWEAAGASQQLTGYLGDDHPLPPHESGVQPVAGHSSHNRDTPPRRSSPRPRRRHNPMKRLDPLRVDHRSRGTGRFRGSSPVRSEDLRNEHPEVSTVVDHHPRRSLASARIRSASRPTVGIGRS